MNLHLIPNNNFLNQFIAHSDRICGEAENRFVVVLPRYGKVAANQQKINKQVPYVAFGSKEFNSAIGDINNYAAIFIHYLSPDLSKWVVKNKAYKGKLLWGFWGADFFSPFRLFSDFIYDDESKKYQSKHGTFTSTANPIINFAKQIKYNLLDKIISKKTEQIKIEALARIDYVLHYNELDIALIRQRYPNFRAIHKDFYYLDYNFDEIQLTTAEFKERSKQKFNLTTKFVVQIGHNSSVSNNHISILNVIKGDIADTTFIIPLSYGDKRYTHHIKSIAKQKLGDNALPIEEFMSKEKYMELLAAVDTCIMNHKRAEAGSNIVLLLAMGKAVYMNPTNNLYQYFITNGIQIGAIDPQSINVATLVSPIPFSIVKSNSDKIKALFSTKKALEQTKLIYDLINQGK